MGRVLVILGQPLADVGGSDSHDWVLARVVVVALSEDLDADYTFAQRFPLLFESSLNHVAKHVLALLAGAKGGATEYVLHGTSNYGWLDIGCCLMCLRHALLRCHFESPPIEQADVNHRPSRPRLGRSFNEARTQRGRTLPK